MQDRESEGGSGSESSSEPTEHDSEEELMLQELLQRNEAKRAGKVRERERASGRAREAEEAEAEEAARRAAGEPRRTGGGASS